MKIPSASAVRPHSPCQSLAHHARERPAAVAVVHRALQVTFGMLSVDVLKVIDYLAATGIRPGQVMGVETGDRYQHLVILLAAEAFGVTTMSLAPAPPLAELGPPADLGWLCDRIMVSQPPAIAEPGRFLQMPPAGVAIRPDRLTSRRLEELEREPEPDFLVRLITSSGTTGVPKVMGMTHRVLQSLHHKAALYAPSWMLSKPAYLCVYDFGVRASHARAMLTLQFGGTIHFTGIDTLWNLIHAGIGNYLLLVAGDLERLVRTARHGSGPFRVYLDVIGAAVSPRLRQEVRAKLTEHLLVTYSSNEVNRVSLVDEDNVGALFPGVSVRIVDEQGKSLPMAQPGLIQVKTDTMTHGYINAPDLTRAAFVDGWFRTSDVGFQPSEGKLVVLGRSDDMLNIGGVKIAPGPIEQRLKLINGVRDALVTGIDDDQETRVMLVAIEVNRDADNASLVQVIAPIIQAQMPYFRMILLPAFPRTETGKIRREAVKALYREKAHPL